MSINDDDAAAERFIYMAARSKNRITDDEPRQIAVYDPWMDAQTYSRREVEAMVANLKERPRFFMDQDNDCHWYIIPQERGDEWHKWKSIPDGDERGWTVPDWAKPIGESHTLVTFEDPEIFGDE